MGIEVHLEEILKKKQITSKELAKIIGITEANLSILRSGKAKGDILKFDGKLGEDDEENK